MLVTDSASAEMIKYASNAFLATKISFINAIANLCEAVDADVRAVALGMGYDPRIGFEFLHPGPGYGGSCFPKDTAALIHTAEAAGYDFSLLRGVVEVNDTSTSASSTKVRAAPADARPGPGRGLGPHLQGQHRRPAGLAGARVVRRLLKAPGRLRSAREHGVLAEEVARPEVVAGAYDPAAGEGRAPAAAPGAVAGASCVPRPVRRLPGRHGPRRAHRVGRVPLARLRRGSPQ